jgi:hypothetical protein
MIWIIFFIILSVWLAALAVTGLGGLIHALMTMWTRPADVD